MKTREIATEIFLRATERLRPTMRDADIKKIVESSIKWANIANDAFEQDFPEGRAALAPRTDAERPRVRPGGGTATATVSRDPASPTARANDSEGAEEIVPPGHIGG